MVEARERCLPNRLRPRFGPRANRTRGAGRSARPPRRLLVGSSGDLGLAKILIAAMIVKRKNTGFEKFARVARAPFSPRAHLRRRRRLPFNRGVAIRFNRPAHIPFP
jgi:hypothetical protein